MSTRSATRTAAQQRRKAVSNKIRRYPIDGLYERYGPFCCWCSELVPRDEATREHLIKVSEGGPTNWSNLRLAHYKCNQSREGHIPGATKPNEVNRANKVKGVRYSLTKAVVFPERSSGIDILECPDCGEFKLYLGNIEEVPAALCEMCDFVLEMRR